MRREGWLRVSSSRGVRRLFVVSDGFVVKCFATPPSAAPKRGSIFSKSKARISFDLPAFTRANTSYYALKCARAAMSPAGGAGEDRVAS